MAHKHPILAVLLLSAAPALASPGAGHSPPPDDKARPELLELRGKLAGAGPEGARRDRSRFRPLCDRDGYPLVGNIEGKRVYQVSQFCAEVRKGQS